MHGVVPLDEGALHEAILRRSGSGVRGSGPQPGSRKLASAPPGRHYDRSARSSLDEEARVTGKARFTQALPEARSPSLNAAVERRQARRPSGRTYELPKRRVGAPPPSFEGRERRTKGGPALTQSGRRSVGLLMLISKRAV